MRSEFSSDDREMVLCCVDEDVEMEGEDERE